MSSPKYRLTLFVTSGTSDRALVQLGQIIRGLPDGDYELHTVDIGTCSDVTNAFAKEHQIKTAPALLCQSEGKLDRVFQSLDDDYAIRYALGLTKLW